MVFCKTATKSQVDTKYNEFCSKYKTTEKRNWYCESRDGTRNSSSLDPRGPGLFFTPRTPRNRFYHSSGPRGPRQNSLRTSKIGLLTFSLYFIRNHEYHIWNYAWAYLMWNYELWSRYSNWALEDYFRSPFNLASL